MSMLPIYKNNNKIKTFIEHELLFLGLGNMI